VVSRIVSADQTKTLIAKIVSLFHLFLHSLPPLLRAVIMDQRSDIGALNTSVHIKASAASLRLVVPS
jgi:hypothetical protein